MNAQDMTSSATMNRGMRLGLRATLRATDYEFAHERHDDDNDHSYTPLPVHRALTCREEQSAWAVAPVGERKFASQKRGYLGVLLFSDVVSTPV